ncbi:MAG: hypothetical protein V4657_13465 [Pseudomonadota bacterium]
MAIMAADSGGGDFKRPTPGNHIAICTLIVDLGRQHNRSPQFGDSIKHQIYVRWELTDEPLEWQDKDTGEQKSRFMSIGKFYTVSLHEKANLRKDLESWRGTPFTEEQAKGFDVAKLLGAPCMLNVIDNVGNDGNVRSKVSAIAPLHKSIPKPTPTEPLVIYDDEHPDVYPTLPEWLRKKVDEQVTAQTLSEIATDDPEAWRNNPLDDDVPF